MELREFDSAFLTHPNTHTHTITILNIITISWIFVRTYCASLVDLPDFIETCFLLQSSAGHVPTSWLYLLPLSLSLVWIPGTSIALSIWSLFSASSHSIWKSCWWPQTMHLDFTPCCSFPVATGVIRLGARYLSLELQYLFSNLLGLGLCLPDIHCLQGHSSWTLDLGFHWTAPAGSVTASIS